MSFCLHILMYKMKNEDERIALFWYKLIEKFLELL